jgi:hypothetical protein
MKIYVALVATVALLLASRTAIFGGHTAQVGLVSAGVLAFLIWTSLPGGARAVPGHSHSGTRARVARHEAGHVVAARAVNGRVTSAALHSTGGGLVQWYHRSHPGEEKLRQHNITFLLAGEYAAGTGAGCSGDRSAVRSELRRLPSKDRGRVMSRAKSDARRIVSARSGEINRIAKRLDEKGKL